MKKLIFLSAVALWLFAMMSCETEEQLVNEQETAENELKSTSASSYDENHVNDVTDLVGKVLYNKDLKKWCLLVTISNTFDDAVLYIPNTLEDNYKKENEKVMFSGNVFTTKLKPVLPAGTTCYSINLTSIIKIQ